jgi:hypothetical protein
MIFRSIFWQVRKRPLECEGRFLFSQKIVNVLFYISHHEAGIYLKKAEPIPLIATTFLTYANNVKAFTLSMSYSVCRAVEAKESQIVRYNCTITDNCLCYFVSNIDYLSAVNKLSKSQKRTKENQFYDDKVYMKGAMGIRFRSTRRLPEH